MICINCNGTMKLIHKGNTAKHYKFRRYKCPDCDYEETAFGSQGIDKSREIAHEKVIETTKKRVESDKKIDN